MKPKHDPKALMDLLKRVDQLLGLIAPCVALDTLTTDEVKEMDNVMDDVASLVMDRAAQVMGRLGGSTKSKRKSKAARANGKKGGRPKKSP